MGRSRRAATDAAHSVALSKTVPLPCRIHSLMYLMVTPANLRAHIIIVYASRNPTSPGQNSRSRVVSRRSWYEGVYMILSELGDAHRRSCIVRIKQSIEGCSSSFASCALAFSSPAILLPFFSLLSYNKTNASFAQQLSSLPSIVFTPHSPVLPKRPKRAPKSSPDA